MMEYAIALSAVFALLTIYKVTSMRMALMLREPMAKAVGAIVQDDAASPALKRLALASFHVSLVPGAVLRALLPWHRPQLPCDDLLALSQEERERFAILIRKHFFKVNLIAGLHWYFLFIVALVLVTMVMGLFSKGARKGTATLSHLENRMMNPRECWHS